MSMINGCRIIEKRDRSMKNKMIITCLLVSMLFIFCSCAKSYKDYDAGEARNLGDQTIEIINNKKVRNSTLAYGDKTHRLLFQKEDGNSSGQYAEKGIYVKDNYEYVYAHIGSQEKVYYKDVLISTKEKSLDDFLDLYVRSFISIDLNYVEQYTYEIKSYQNLWNWKDQYQIEHEYVFDNEYTITFDFMGKKYEINDVILNLTNDTAYENREYVLWGSDTTTKELVSYSFYQDQI